jgi:hypothetical protein
MFGTIAAGAWIVIILYHLLTVLDSRCVAAESRRLALHELDDDKSRHAGSKSSLLNASPLSTRTSSITALCVQRRRSKTITD